MSMRCSRMAEVMISVPLVKYMDWLGSIGACVDVSVTCIFDIYLPTFLSMRTLAWLGISSWAKHIFSS